MKTEYGTGRKFQVVITEIYQRKITVGESELKKPTVEEAKSTVLDWWRSEQIVLTKNDFSNVTVSAEEVK